MRELKRQIRRQKAKVILLALALWLAASVGFAAFMYDEQLERAATAAQALEQIAPWGLGFAAISLLWILAVILVLEYKDDHKRVLQGLTELESETLARETVGSNLFRLKFTAGSTLVILNANGYTLKLIPIRDITQIRMEKSSGAKPRLPNFSVMHLRTKSGKQIRSSAIAVTDPLHPLMEAVFDDLASRVAGNNSKQADAAANIYCAAFESLDAGCEETYLPLMTLSYAGAEAETLVLAKFIGGDVGDTLEGVCADALYFAEKQARQGIVAKRYLAEETPEETKKLDRLEKQLEKLGVCGLE